MKTEFVGIEYSPESDACWVHVVEIDPADENCESLSHYTVVVPDSGREPYLDGPHPRAAEIIAAGVKALPTIAHYMEPLQ